MDVVGLLMLGGVIGAFYSMYRKNEVGTWAGAAVFMTSMLIYKFA